MEIIATISKNSYAPARVREIVAAGATTLRYNFSHGSPAQQQERIAAARAVVDQPITILADLPGGKLRLGMFADSQAQAITAGTALTFKGNFTESNNVNEFVPVAANDLGKFLQVGDTFTHADGQLAFEVTAIIDENTITAVALNDEHLYPLKAINIGPVLDQFDHLTTQTQEHLAQLAKIKPEWVAFSFVRSAAQLAEFKAALAPYLTAEWQPKIVVKLETPQAIVNVQEIAAAADILMVARGDLGLTMPYAELGVSTQKIIEAAKTAGKPVIVATQLLDSLESSFVPNRAEVDSLSHLVWDGVDAIMFARETGVAPDPARTIRAAREIITAAEAYQTTGRQAAA